MKKLKVVFLAISVLVLSMPKAWGQAYVNSAYSFYGIGDISPKGFGTNSMLGGTGFALRDGYSINTLNPASYNAIRKPLTQLTEFSWDLSYGTWTENDATYSQPELSFNGLAFWFRLNNKSALTLGLSPYSKIDYNITTSNSLDGLAGDYSVNYTGSGGLSKVYLGSAYEVFRNFNVGADLIFVFGPLNQDQLISSDILYLNYSNKKQVSLSGFMFDLGMQYSFDINKSTLTLGAVFNNNKELKGISSNFLYNDTDTLIETSSSIDGYFVPRTIGGGVSFTKNKKWLVTADYEYQFWKDFDLEDRYKINDSQRFSAGIELLPDMAATSYLKHIGVGVGAFYRNSYLEIDGQPINDFGFTGGLKLPTGGKLIANLTYQRLFRANDTVNLIKENYHNITMNLAFFDFWFQKQKFD